MKKNIYSLLLCFLTIFNTWGQTTILDFEAPMTTADFQYFQSSLEPTLANIIPNPNPSGSNFTATVCEHIKPANASTFAGAFADPQVAINTNGGIVKIDILMDHIGNFLFKLEGSTTGQPNYEQLITNTKVNEWETITIDTNVPSGAAPNQPASGTYNRVTLFFDFGSPGGSVDVTSYFDNLTSTGVATSTSPVDFSVDMNNYPSPFGTVYVSGTFNGWSGNANPLSDPDNDGVWTGTIDLLDDNYEFKFSLDNWAAEETFAPGGSCTVTTGIFTNRFITVTGPQTLPVYCWNSCSGCMSNPNPLVDFSVDMNDYPGSFNTVYVSGTFNSWSGTADPLSDPDNDGVWTGSIHIPVGVHDYKISLDDWNVEEQFLGTEECTKIKSGFINRELVSGSGGTVIPKFCWNSCYECGDEAVITFRVNMDGIAADPNGIWLSGGGNFDVPGGRYRMDDSDGDGIWEIEVPRQIGFSSYFIFANGPCANFSCKEIIAGLPCSDPANFDDRFLPPVQGDVSYETCYEQCTDNVQCTYPALVPTITKIDLDCHGDTDGAINIAVTGGSTIHTFEWDNGSTSSSRSNLSAGDYTVTITDAIAGEALEQIITINEPDALENNSSLGNIDCFGTTTGFVELNIGGGTMPYNVLWNTGATTTTILDLPAGTYTANITDGNNCMFTVTETLIEPSSALSVSTSTTNANCGNADGSITLTVSGGTATYSYLWSDGPTIRNRTGLAAGTYTVTVTDFLDCIMISTATVDDAGSAVTVAASETNVSCFGGMTGSINLMVNSGTAPYSFDWGGGMTTQNRTNLSAGTYVVTVTDANNCTATMSSTITQPASTLLAAAQSTGVTCFGGMNGTVTIAALGGTAPYSYDWGNGITTPSQSNLAAGSYTVTVMDDNGCTSTVTEVVSGPTNPLTTTASTINVDCYNASTGSIFLTVIGGTANYSFDWGGGYTFQNRINLPAGTYVVTVTDANNCTNTISNTITQPVSPLITTAQSTGISCFGELSGSVSINASGGTAPYSYDWGNSITTSSQSNLVAGVYTATVTDDNGCSNIVSETVSGPTQELLATATSSDVACFGAATGSIMLSVTGGTSNYLFNWGGGITDQNRTGLTGGTYTATITDANGCTTTVSETISEPSSGLSALATSSNVDCFGAATGSIMLSVSGGASNYTFDWGGGITDQNRTGLASGTYTITITDANGCTTTISETISEPSSGLSAMAMSSDVDCFGEATGSIMLSVTGGASNYTFDWGGGITDQNRTGLTSGIYSVVITDASGCTTSISETISEPNSALSALVTSNDVACFGEATGSIILSVTGGTSNYTFDWGGGITDQNRTGLTGGTYTAIITDANGCTTTVSETISEPNNVLSALATSNDVACFGEATGSIMLSVAGGTSNYTFDWGGGITDQNRTGLTGGTYTATITDANGCTTTVSETISEPSTAVLATATSNDISCNGFANGTANASAMGGTGSYSYSWSNGASDATIASLAVGTYSVTVMDANNCISTTSVSISQPDALLAMTSATGQTANGVNDGTASVSVSGGTSGYSYLWSNGATDASISGLAPDTYSVVITDANGCTTQQTVTVNSFNCAMSSSISGVDITCNGDNDGSASMTLQGATGTIVYAWSNGASDASITGLAAGTYVVTATDGTNCSSTQSVTINEPQALIANASSTGISSVGMNDGTATATGIGGTGMLTYLWSNGATDATITGLAPGIYTVTISDANGCTQSSSTNVNAVNCALTSSLSATDVSCFGANDGTAAITVLGSTSALSYTWSNGMTGAAISNLGLGTYTCDFIDLDGCSGTASVMVFEPTEVTASLGAVSNAQCANELGSASVMATGGTGMLSFAWSNGQTDSMAINLTAGMYTVTVSDANDCSATISNIEIIEADTEDPTIIAFPSVNISLDSLGLAALNLNTLGVLASDNCSAVTITFDPLSLDCSNIGVNTVIITGTDASGNTAMTSTVVNVSDFQSPTLNCPSDIVRCFDDATVSFDTPSGEDNCSSQVDVQLTAGSASGSIFPVGSTTQIFEAVDGNGNTATCAFTVEINPEINFIVDDLVNDVNNQGVGSISLQVGGGTMPFNVEWQDASGTVVGAGISLNQLMMGTYYPIITDDNGCVLEGEGIVVDNTVSGKEPSWMQAVTLAPNPTAGRIFVRFTEVPNSQLQVQLIDLHGKMLQSQIVERQQEFSLDLTTFPAGIYLLRISDEKSSGVRRIIVE